MEHGKESPRQSGFIGSTNRFGFSLALDHNTLVVGELSENSDRSAFSLLVSVHKLPLSTVWDSDETANEVLENSLRDTRWHQYH